MILVTGGTGLVGSHLLYHLIKKGSKVRAIHRKTSNLERVARVFSYYSEDAENLFAKIEWLEADINDIPNLEIAFAGIDEVYHCAALISFDPKDYEKMMKINVEGTSNMVNLSLAYKVKKLCYVSSIAAIGKSVGSQIITEENAWNETDANVYALSKHAAELEVWRGSEEGLTTAIINPGVIVGPGFWETGSGMFFKVGARASRFYPPGGSGFVTANDVVKMLIVLMRSPISQERFIAVGQNYSYLEVLTKITKMLHKKAPTRVLRSWHLAILWRLDWFWCFISGKTRTLTKNGVISFLQPTTYSNTKITEETGFTFESIDETIRFSCAKFLNENP